MNMWAAIWKTGMAVLLTLAFSFSWPPVHHEVAGSSNHAMHAETPVFHAHVELNNQLSSLNVKLDLGCGVSEPGCCMMTHCCPCLSVEPHDVPATIGDDGATVASGVRGKGIDPGLMLPPPRAMQV